LKFRLQYRGFRTSPTGAAKVARGKLTADLPRGRARANLQRMRKKAAGAKFFAARTLLRQTCCADYRARYKTPRART
jgi:hypothetical protein